MQILFWLLLGCRTKTIYTDLYKIHSPGYDWKAVESGGADYAWYNKDLGAIIYIDSNCKESFDDRPLRDSRTSLLSGISQGKAISEQAIFLDGRDALMTTHKARLDGVDINLASVVLSKNHCLYDFLYIAPPHRFSYGLQSFTSTIYSFQTKERSVLRRKKEKTK